MAEMFDGALRAYVMSHYDATMSGASGYVTLFGDDAYTLTPF